MSMKTRLDAHFVAAAALAAAGSVGVVENADAAIVYSGIQNLPIKQTTNGLYLNIVTGANNEPANGSGSTVPGWDINPYGTGMSTFYGNAPQYRYVGGATAGSAAVNLALNAPIDSVTCVQTGNAPTTNFIAGQPGIYGFRFQNEAMGNALQYGWARIIKVVGASPATGTLVDWAYEDSGAGIPAGAVPAPGSVALLALGALGLTGRRRK